MLASGQVEVKEVHKSLAKITDGLYASKYEVSNSQYRAFIRSLIETHQKETLKMTEVDSSKPITIPIRSIKTILL